MREKPKRFSISLPPDLTERLKKAQEAYDPRLSRRALLETLIRKGLEESVINTLAALKVPGIVYISCNPKTQKRDVELFQKLGYRMECLYGFDMFPHTCHVETVVLLSRDKS